MHLASFLLLYDSGVSLFFSRVSSGISDLLVFLLKQGEGDYLKSWYVFL